MERLFLFVYQYRAFFSFLLLEFICAWLIVSSNHYQRAQFFNSSGSMVAGLNSFSYDVSEYFSLRETNVKLAEENADLRNRLESSIEALNLVDTVQEPIAIDSIQRFDYISAKVVNNSVDRFTNFITLDKGSDAGIETGMAVISHWGIVGKVKATSRHYSVVTSVLNIDVMVSAIIKRTGHFGTVQWNGRNPLFVSLNYIPRHVTPLVGDSIITSGYNAVFPEGVMIGIVEEVELGDAALFHDIKVKLSQDFQQLDFVTVVKSELKTEQDSLEQPFNPIAP